MFRLKIASSHDPFVTFFIEDARFHQNLIRQMLTPTPLVHIPVGCSELLHHPSCSRGIGACDHAEPA